MRLQNLASTAARMAILLLIAWVLTTYVVRLGGMRLVYEAIQGMAFDVGETIKGMINSN